MKRIVNKFALVAIASSLSFALLPNGAFASSNKNTEINRIQNKRIKVQEQTQKVKNEIEQLRNKQEVLVNSLDSINTSIEHAKEVMREKEIELVKGKKEIAIMQDEIMNLQNRLDQRQVIIDDRLRTLQKSGGNKKYLDILFGASNIGELFQGINTIAKFMDSDQDILVDQQNDLKKVEQKEKDLYISQTKLENDKEMLQNLNRTLMNQEIQMKAILEKLKSEIHEKEHDVLSLEEQEELLEEQEKAIKSASKNSHSSGEFMRPADGYVSSGFGYRSFDNEEHSGVDIVKKGNVPIVSVADGVVIRAYKSSSYGNVVFITHNIDGKVFTSVYAHMSSFKVSSGQSISKGQAIGTMGNTGKSFGQHLHFELHEGQWNQAKSNAVDPAKYIHF
ncbi:murein hydrolase activator EnvC family protein [Gottfriedia solisilvae]|uniref:murein hydrolase activator EnvC family protein n=1 Tax=Gottfriedia solisilvae TaxID=1516104 RepID=UPI003D2EBADE